MTATNELICDKCGDPGAQLGAFDSFHTYEHGWHCENHVNNMNSGVGYELFGGFPEMQALCVICRHGCMCKTCVYRAAMREKHGQNWIGTSWQGGVETQLFKQDGAS